MTTGMPIGNVVAKTTEILLILALQIRFGFLQFQVVLNYITSTFVQNSFTTR